MWMCVIGYVRVSVSGRESAYLRRAGVRVPVHVCGCD